MLTANYASRNGYTVKNSSINYASITSEFSSGKVKPKSGCSTLFFTSLFIVPNLLNVSCGFCK